MSEQKLVLGRTLTELDALAKEAVERAVTDLHAKGISTYHLEHGRVIETLPDGTTRDVEPPPASQA
jgi:hypothetical protein